jgi:hypothetical protein
MIRRSRVWRLECIELILVFVDNKHLCAPTWFLRTLGRELWNKQWARKNLALARMLVTSSPAPRHKPSLFPSWWVN